MTKSINKNRYFQLRFAILILLLKKNKLSFLKIVNAISCYLYYIFKFNNSPKSPIVINIELWNECNEACKFCRTVEGQIYDQSGKLQSLPKGVLKFEAAKSVIAPFKNRLLLAIPYINGEPLISKILIEFLSYCKENSVATMIASNGIKLDLNKSQELINNDLDILKIHISGMTNEIHRIEHTTGDVNKILNNLRNFQILNRKFNNKTLLILDYILYKHNIHQINDVKEFCTKNNILLNIRPGNTDHLTEESLQKIKLIPESRCDWVYTTMAVDWNGNVLPCCDFVTWSDPYTYGNVYSQHIDDIWQNNKEVKNIRNIHNLKGRKGIETCKNCPKQGLKFKY